MIQKTNARHSSTTVTTTARPGSSTLITDNPEQHWGSWSGNKHYSLEVLQHPLRARMCGFGDKDRRPLAPAAVAKMVIRREDNNLVEVDDIDVAFFVVTVDLWSADGKHEMNLVLHPSSADRYVPTHVSKPRRRGNTSSVPPQRSDPASSQQPGSITPLPTPSTAGYPPQGYPFSAPPTSAAEPPPFSSPPYAPHTDPSAGWGYPPHHPAPHTSADRSASLPSIQSFNRDDPDAATASYRAWNGDDAFHVDPSANPSVPPPGVQQPPEAFAHTRYPPDAYNAPIDGAPVYATAPYPQQQPQQQQQSPPPPPPPTQQHAPYGPPSPPSSSVPLPRHTYTRTLVGPLSANACRLADEHRKPGIFFLFQDLSIRTEGTFRLRLRLMNVGAPPAPEPGALRVSTGISPILAQTFTEPFVVYSAKRFPGVPDTTALSIAFGNQGQKLPLRNRHGSRQHGRRRRRGDSDGSDDDSDGT